MAYTQNTAQVAQLVEHFPEEEGVAGSSPALGTSIKLSALFNFDCYLGSDLTLKSLTVPSNSL